MKRPTIRTTIILVVGGLFCIFIFFLSFRFNKELEELLRQREHDYVKQHAEIASAILRTSMRTLPDATHDWARWDSTYSYMKGENPEFLATDLNADLFMLYKLNFAVLLDTNFAIKYERFFDFIKADDVPIENAFIAMRDDMIGKLSQAARDEGALERDAFNQNGISGFIVSGDTWFYVSAFPILPSTGKGISNGVLIFGRVIDDREITRSVKGINTVRIQRVLYEQRTMLAEKLEDEPFLVHYPNQNTIRVYHKIETLYGDNILFSLEFPRKLYQQGLHVITNLNISVLVTSIAVLILLFFLLEKLLLKPLKSIAQQVACIDDIDFLHIRHEYWGYELNTLVEALRKMLKRLARTRKVIEEQNNSMKFIITHDRLTGLPNSLHIKAILEEKQEVALSDSDLDLHFFYIHITNLKIVNAILGLSAGDAALIRLAERLKQCCFDAISIACVDGHKFAVLYDGETLKPDGPKTKCNIIARVLEEPLVLENRQVRLTVAIGVASYPANTQEIMELHRNANIAANAALADKTAHSFVYNNGLFQSVTDRLNKEKAIEEALERDEFVPFFQPKLDLATEKITGAEALIRWVTPHGILPPKDFLRLADETGMIIEMTWMMLEKACVENQKFAAAGFDITMAVNVPVQVVLHTNFVHQTLDVLYRTGMPPHKLDIEITEETLIVDIVKTCAIITELQSYGIEVSVDDFGTGYSSLQYLKDMPFNTMKIDKTFIDGVPGDIYSEAIIKASVEMAGALKLKVVAEGVETKEQWAIVKQLGCHQVQGYVVSKPVASDEFLLVLHQWNT